MPVAKMMVSQKGDDERNLVEQYKFNLTENKNSKDILTIDEHFVAAGNDSANIDGFEAI